MIFRIEFHNFTSIPMDNFGDVSIDDFCCIQTACNRGLNQTTRERTHELFGLILSVIIKSNGYFGHIFFSISSSGVNSLLYSMRLVANAKGV